MKHGGRSAAEHKLDCLRPVARAPLDDAARSLLVSCIETYIQLDEPARAKYERLLADEPSTEGSEMETTWAQTLEAIDSTDELGL